MKPAKLEKVLIWCYPIFAGLFSSVVPTNFFVSIFIFFVIPALYLSFQHPEYVRKTATFAAILSVPFIMVIDYIMERTGGWLIPYSVFGTLRIFEFVTVDIIFWSFL